MIIELALARQHIDDNKPHKVSEVICIKCMKRWISVREETVLLKELECPNCGRIESVVETGEDLSTCDKRKEQKRK